MWNRTAHLILVCVGAIAAGCGQPAEGPAPAAGIPVTVGDTKDAPAEAAEPAAEPAASGGIAGVQWTLVEVAGEAIGDVFEGREAPSLLLDAETLTASGFAGCNRFSGGYEMTDAGGLSFSRMVATRMACPELGIESKFFAALETVRGYALVDSRLELKDEGSAVVLRFEAAP